MQELETALEYKRAEEVPESVHFSLHLRSVLGRLTCRNIYSGPYLVNCQRTAVVEPRSRDVLENTVGDCGESTCCILCSFISLYAVLHAVRMCLLREIEHIGAFLVAYYIALGAFAA